MSYRENYENWLNSPALSQEEKAVPKASWSKKRDSISFSSMRIASSSAFYS